MKPPTHNGVIDALRRRFRPRWYRLPPSVALCSPRLRTRASSVHRTPIPLERRKNPNEQAIRRRVEGFQ